MPLSNHLLRAAAAAALLVAGPVLAEDIVVTGKPLKDTAADLEECIKRGCPPNEDMAATLAHAENQFVAGDYHGSRKTLRESLGRNRKHGKAYPVELSSVLRANGRVAEHLGEAKSFQISTLDMRDTLKSGLGADDFRTLAAQIEVGDSRAKLGFPLEADQIYRDVEKRALELKHYRVATFARLRQAMLAQNRFEDDPSARNRAVLDERLAQMIDSPLPNSDDFVLVAKVLRARKDRKAGSNASTDELIKSFAQKGGAARPVLLFAEPLSKIDPWAGQLPVAGGMSNGRNTYSTKSNGQWVDLGFWIGQDGHVSDVEVLRSSGGVNWAKPVMGNIAKRVYAPLRQDGDAAAGFYMVERYTLVARVTDQVTGTHVRVREQRPRIEMIELTAENNEGKPVG